MDMSKSDGPTRTRRLLVAVLSRSFAKASPRPIDYLESHGFRVTFRLDHDPADEVSVAESIEEADAAIVAAQDTISSLVFDRCPHLKVIVDHAVGYDKLDIEGARARGIAVATCPGNHESVADLTWLLILATSRQFLSASASVRDGKWQPNAFVGLEVFQKTLGIIGYGRIGKAVARRAIGFENRVLIYDPFVTQVTPILTLTPEKVPLNALLTESDIITLHVPLDEHTAHMIDREAIAMMKDGVILINTARGGLVDEQALYEALNTGKVRMAGLDSFAQEPPVDSPLIGVERVIPTPHMGAQTYDANLRMGMMAADFIVQTLKGQ